MANLWSAIAIVLAGLLFGSCTRQEACPGPSPGPGVAGHVDARASDLLATRTLADLSCWAESNNEMAQYALGKAYENGIGVSADREAALRYYRAAATTIPDQTFVYVPPVGEKTSGRVMPVNTGKGRTGLSEAKKAVERLTESTKQS